MRWTHRPPVAAYLERRWSTDDGSEALAGQLKARHVLRQLHLDTPVPQRLLLRGQHGGAPLRLILHLRHSVEGHQRLSRRTLRSGGRCPGLRQERLSRSWRTARVSETDMLGSYHHQYTHAVNVCSKEHL